MGQIAQVVLEGREPGNHLSLPSECWHSVGDDLIGIRNDAEDVRPELLEGGPGGLVDAAQISVDLFP